MNRLTEKHNGIYSIDTDYYNENTNIRLTGEVVDRLAVYEDVEEKLIEKLYELTNRPCADGIENYTTGYRNGHKNGQIELLQWILGINVEDTKAETCQ